MEDMRFDIPEVPDDVFSDKLYVYYTPEDSDWDFTICDHAEYGDHEFGPPCVYTRADQAQSEIAEPGHWDDSRDDMVRAIMALSDLPCTEDEHCVHCAIEDQVADLRCWLDSNPGADQAQPAPAGLPKEMREWIRKHAEIDQIVADCFRPKDKGYEEGRRDYAAAKQVLDWLDSLPREAHDGE